MNREFIIDFINFDIIAIFFLFIPFSLFCFIMLTGFLIVDLISLYICEKRETKDTFDFENDYRYDSWEG